MGPEPPEELQDSRPRLQRLHVQLQVDEVVASGVHAEPAPAAV